MRRPSRTLVKGSIRASRALLFIKGVGRRGHRSTRRGRPGQGALSNGRRGHRARYRGRMSTGVRANLYFGFSLEGQRSSSSGKGHGGQRRGRRGLIPIGVVRGGSTVNQASYQHGTNHRHNRTSRRATSFRQGILRGGIRHGQRNGSNTSSLGSTANWRRFRVSHGQVRGRTGRGGGV